MDGHATSTGAAARAQAAGRSTPHDARRSSGRAPAFVCAAIEHPDLPDVSRQSQNNALPVRRGRLHRRDRPALRQEPVASHVESRSWFGTYASRCAVPSRTGRPRAHRHRRLPDVQTCDPVEQHVHHAALLTCRSRSATPGGLSARHRPRCSQQQSTDSREAPRHAPLRVTRPVCADVAKRHPRFSSPAMFGRRPKCHTPLAFSVPISSGEIACHAQTEARFSPVRRCNRTG
jgi:hypothetical protein